MVKPIGGLEGIHQKLNYPKEALENKIEGKVYVLIIIDSVGNLLCPKVIKGLGYGCDQEAMRVVTDTKFISTLHRGKPITTLVSIPITFKLPQ